MNPIRQKLKSHANKYPELNAKEAELREIYLSARQRIEDRLADYARNARNSFTGPRMAQLMDEIQEIFPSFEEEYREGVRHAYSWLADRAYKAAGYDMGYKKQIIGKMNKALFENTLADDFTHVAGATKKMETTVIGALRRASAKVMRESSLTGETRQEVSRRIYNSMGRDFAFVDAAGKTWNSDAYFEMLGRTMLHNNARESYLAGCASEGSDIVTISVSGDPCDHCREWEGQLLSISGKTRGLPMLQSAMEGGLFHPRCTHRIIAVPPEVAAEYYDKNGKEKNE